jgi:hypothetical protein
MLYPCYSPLGTAELILPPYDINIIIYINFDELGKVDKAARFGISLLKLKLRPLNN